MNIRFVSFSTLLILIILWACTGVKKVPAPAFQNQWKVKSLPASPQDWSGDPEAGYQYLIYGDYIGTGIPYEVMKKRIKGKDTLLQREGLNAYAPAPFNVFKTQYGVDVLSGNCLTCHASKLRGVYIPGLGNAFSDFQDNGKATAKLMNMAVRSKYKKSSPEYESFDEFGRFYEAIAPKIITPNPGVNPAFRLEEACVQYRNHEDLTYTKEAQFETMKYTLASDVPPLWNLKKKHALYYNGMGRGDFRKLLMQASVLGIEDSTAARQVLPKFIDVVAWAANLEPPQYPGSIDQDLAARGAIYFAEHCQKCHGTYGAEETYPNKLVSLEVVKTDPYYAEYFTTSSGLADWYNQSWFANSEPASSLVPSDGYIAPPLDGIWATAPYLHNGSVPTLEALLDSSKRPAFWQKAGGSQAYSLEKIGWEYQTFPKDKGKQVYDTTLPGYSNEGHYFGDILEENERKALMEYLKTL